MRRLAASLLVGLALAACSPSGETTTTTAPTSTTPPSTAATTTSPPTTVAAPATTAPPTTVAGLTPDVIVTGSTVDGPDTFEYDLGEDVEIVVLADVADEIHVHGYDLSFDTEPGVPVTVEFTADVPGIFEVELESVSLPLFDIQVNG